MLDGEEGGVLERERCWTRVPVITRNQHKRAKRGDSPRPHQAKLHPLLDSTLATHGVPVSGRLHQCSSPGRADRR